MAAASHSKCSSVEGVLGSRYPPLSSGSAPYRLSFLQMSTRWLALFAGKLKISSSQLLAVWRVTGMSYYVIYVTELIRKALNEGRSSQAHFGGTEWRSGC